MLRPYKQQTSQQRLQYAAGNLVKIGGTLQRTVLYCVCA